ncbi:MAG: FAD-dependent oxidoreductase [bacterium]|nr:FAD-dependent oxidoreductase [bacterium]MDE0287033.1 FAD-dependent oxidoreductase [bacterium]MDE0440467.1 FAD-dependent oxidoreductase [bacterium]
MSVPVPDAPSVVVVGASLGGLRTASALRRLGFKGRITLAGEETHLPYDRPPLSKEVLTGEKQPDDAIFRTADFFEDQGIELRLGSPAVVLDGDARSITLASGERLGYDAAVIATGARPRRLPGVGSMPGVHVMRTLDDSRAIRSALDDARHLVVVGAGFIGSEVAASARSRGIEVTVIEAADQPLVTAVGAKVGQRCAALHGAYGAELRCGVGVVGVEDGAEGLAVHLTDGTAVPADVVVVGIGVIPNIEWLEGSGIETDRAVICDEYMRTSLPGVYALGDLASWYNRRFEQRMRIEHWTNTVEQSTAVARNIVNSFDGDDPVAYSGIPYFWSDQYGHRLQLVGLASQDEVVFVHDPPGERTLLALYRQDDRLGGAFAIDMMGPLMKMRRLLLRDAAFDEALEHAATL